MQSWNYAQIVQAMQDWPVKASGDYLANINRMIFMGERRLIVDLDLDIFDVVDTAPVALADGATQVSKPSYSTAITFTAPLGQGATTGTLTENWAGNSGQYAVTFQDSVAAGLASTWEYRLVSLTNGLPSAAWSAPLTNGVLVGALVNSQFVVERNLWVIYEGAQERLVKRSYDYVIAYANAAPGRPKYYCDLGQNAWLFAPACDANATGIIRKYTVRPVSIVVAGTSWLGDTLGDALFAACLMESEHYLKADDRYADFRTKYYQELMPAAMQEIAIARRAGKYTPLNPIASVPMPMPPPPPQQ